MDEQVAVLDVGSERSGRAWDERNPEHYRQPEDDDRDRDDGRTRAPDQ